MLNFKVVELKDGELPEFPVSIVAVNNPQQSRGCYLTKYKKIASIYGDSIYVPLYKSTDIEADKQILSDCVENNSLDSNIEAIMVVSGDEVGFVVFGDL